MKYFILLFFLAFLIIILAFIFIAKNFLDTFKHFNIFSLNTNNDLTFTEDEPKSISSMESIYLSRLKEDFPLLNLHEFKSMTEETIREIFKAIESGSETFDNTKINNFITHMKNKNIKARSLKIHKTSLINYEKNAEVATITLGVSLEYMALTKVQTRLKIEYVYTIDSSKVKSARVSLNCPNCGAPIRKIGHKYCDYCKTGIADVISRTWVLNRIKEY